jgi:membrane associated rhomboid family serine protease
MGSARFLIFYLICGFIGAIIQAYINPTSTIPAIGASGAISGVLGAYWILFPRAKVITLIPLIFVPWFIEIPAVFYLGFWLFT